MATVVQDRGAATRLQFIDNIRWALIVLVISQVMSAAGITTKIPRRG
ncbi:MAG TPA: hypothetical protein VK604_28065 [Bryobacteraceae bacterium]|nr:hypothetical protein [Bryobacteraceae bacterium]